MTIRKYSTLQTLSVTSGDNETRRFVKTAHRHSFEYTVRPGFIYVSSRAISSRTNDNFDSFAAEEIAKSWHTFKGRPVFVNHVNEDHRIARGVIIDAALHEDRNRDGSADTWVEVLMEVDAKNFPKLAKEIIAGNIERTSMGVDVERSECSACGNLATRPSEFCSHIPRLKGKKFYKHDLKTGKKKECLIFERCSGLSFFENSLLVEPPADPTAFVLHVDASGMNAKTPHLARTASGNHRVTVDYPHKDRGLITHRDFNSEIIRDPDTKEWHAENEYGEVLGRHKDKHKAVNMVLDHYDLKGEVHIEHSPDPGVKGVRADTKVVKRAMRKGAPFATYEDFEDCENQNADKEDPSAYCGEIKHRTEDSDEGSKKEAAKRESGERHLPHHPPVGTNHSSPGATAEASLRSVAAHDPYDVKQNKRLTKAPEKGMEPVQHVVDGARAYSKKHGLEDPHPQGAGSYKHIGTKPERIASIAKHYDNMPDNDPKAHHAYDEMRKQVHDQYHHLTKTMGVKVESVHKDPYKDVHEMASDLRDNKRLKVLSTKSTGGHPHFSDEDNDKFRAVHDAFGHAATGRPFDRHGEEAAYVAHSRMFHGPARQAMATETRGQNSSLIANGKFGPQKIGLLPDHMTKREASMSLTERLNRIAASRVAHENPADHPFYKTHPVSAENVREHWDAASPEEQHKGKNWYPHARPIAVAIGKKHLERTGQLSGDHHEDEKKAAHIGAGVLSAFSPRSDWSLNVHNAAAHVMGHPTKAMNSHRAAADKILGGTPHHEALGGPKTQAFAHLIEHGGKENHETGEHSERAVVDRHAVSVAAGHMVKEVRDPKPDVKKAWSADEKAAHAEHKKANTFPAANPHYYKHAEKQYQDTAKQLTQETGIHHSPHEVQAVTWLQRQKRNHADGMKSNPGNQKGRDTAQGNAHDNMVKFMGHHFPDLKDNVHLQPREGTPKQASLQVTAAHDHHTVGTGGSTSDGFYLDKAWEE